MVQEWGQQDRVVMDLSVPSFDCAELLRRGYRVTGELLLQHKHGHCIHNAHPELLIKKVDVVLSIRGDVANRGPSHGGNVQVSTEDSG